MDDERRVRVLVYVESREPGRDSIVGFAPGVFGVAFVREMMGDEPYREALQRGHLVECDPQCPAP